MKQTKAPFALAKHDAEIGKLRVLAQKDWDKVSGGLQDGNTSYNFPTFDWTIGDGPGGDDGIVKD